MSFQGRTAIISGGTRGIGRAISLKLAERGCNIAFNYARSRELAANLVSEISAMGCGALAFELNVADHSAVMDMVKDVKEKFGSIDYLVNNAGIVRDTLLLRMKEKDWDDVIDINLKGAFNVSKAVSPIMLKARSGSILNITSVSGLHGMSGQVNYSASKAGMVGLTKALAKECAGRNIRVNALALGFVETAMTCNFSEYYKLQILKNIPLGRFGKAEEIATIAAFLLSDDAGYITGQVIQVDGGLAI
ncbi:MAG: 3-oxoacyl-[acyl-carrier-protein] reductase [Acidobacteria bacterium]|nr:3-oxoacyl-[acyl-carrier-protein] reductase [Acidobacteriota bacterium]